MLDSNRQASQSRCTLDVVGSALLTTKQAVPCKSKGAVLSAASHCADKVAITKEAYMCQACLASWSPGGP